MGLCVFVAGKGGGSEPEPRVELDAAPVARFGTAIP